MIPNRLAENVAAGWLPPFADGLLFTGAVVQAGLLLAGKVDSTRPG